MEVPQQPAGLLGSASPPGTAGSGKFGRRDEQSQTGGSTWAHGVGVRRIRSPFPMDSPQSESLPSCFADPTADASSSSCPFKRSPAGKNTMETGWTTWIGSDPVKDPETLPSAQSKCPQRFLGKLLGINSFPDPFGKGSSSTNPSPAQRAPSKDHGIPLE